MLDAAHLRQEYEHLGLACGEAAGASATPVHFVFQRPCMGAVPSSPCSASVDVLARGVTDSVITNYYLKTYKVSEKGGCMQSGAAVVRDIENQSLIIAFQIYRNAINHIVPMLSIFRSR